LAGSEENTSETSVGDRWDELMAATVSTVISRTTSGWAAGVVALALVATACSSASGPEAVAPATTAVEPTTTEQSVEPIADSSSATAAEPDGNTDGNTETSDAQPDDETSETAPPSVPAPEALQFTAPLVGGGEIDLAAGFDNKPTVFWFWAPT
jgi:hypothetical protein